MALSIDCRNKHWSQCFNRILIWSSGLSTICLAVVVQAALESRAACTTTAGHIEVEPADEIKIRLKHCGQCLFLQSMLSASIFKWIFDFRIWIPNIHSYFKTIIWFKTALCGLKLRLLCWINSRTGVQSCQTIFLKNVVQVWFAIAVHTTFRLY